MQRSTPSETPSNTSERNIVVAPPSASRVLHWGWVAAGCCVLGLAAFPFDVAIAKMWHAGNYPKFTRELVENTEPFGHAIGVIFILWAIYVLDPARRFALPRIATAAIGAGIMTNLFKLVIGRTRPRNLEIPELATVTETFTTWFPMWNGIFKSQSFPSAHTSVAVAFAVMLSHYFPRGRAMFLTLAACVALDRTQCLAHYLSDVFFGAALGWSVAHVVLTHPAADRLFGRWETSGERKLVADASDEDETASTIQTAA